MIARPLRHQHGATLVVAMIMLVMLTLFALTAMNASNINLKIARNAQTLHEVTAAVQQEIDKALSVNFTINPAAVAGSKPVDINNDSTADYSVAITTPTCISRTPIKNTELDITNPLDQPCFVSGTLDSLCANTRWHITGSATDPLSGANVTIHQGVDVRTGAGSC